MTNVPMNYGVAIKSLAEATCWLICQQSGLTDDETADVWQSVKGYQMRSGLLEATRAEIAVRATR